jgi:hypothetical protein
MTITEEAPKKIKINLQNLYKEDNFTDMQVATVRQLTPVKSNGEIDKSRKVVFIGQTQLMTPRGPLPIQFPIEARNLHEALEKFPEYMEQFMNKMVEEAKEFQRQEQSRLIVPGQGESKIILK